MTAFSRAVEAFNRGDLQSARQIADSECKAAPSPQWNHLLGLIECRSGNHSAGVELLRNAAEAEPANTGFRVMLARALIDSGRPRDALAIEAPADAASAEAQALWWTRAEAAHSANDAGEAVRAWRAIAEARGNDFRSWINLGRSHLLVEDFDKAENAYREALAIAPLDRDALHELALLYERVSRIDSMAALLESAAGAGLAAEQLPFAWAMLEERRGNPERALELLSQPGADRDAVRWWRLKSRAEEAVGNSAAAFSAAAAMNRAAPQFEQWRTRASAYRRQLRKLAAAIRPDWAAKLPVLSPLDRNPVFLLGFPRSGTTLLDTFLMGHPEISVIEESPLLFDASEGIGPTEALPEANPAAVAAARDAYLRRFADEIGNAAGSLAIDKFPLNMVAAPLIHTLFPGAPILFVKRHPCDAVLSGFMQSFTANVGMASFLDLGDAADFYDACMGVWSASTANLPLNVHTVCYEDLVAHPETTLRAVVRFLGLGWDKGLLDHRRTALERGPIGNTSYNQVTEPLSSAAVYRWRRYDKELRSALPVLLPWAERLDYGS